jgi:hypothetical protein
MPAKLCFFGMERRVRMDRFVVVSAVIRLRKQHVQIAGQCFILWIAKSKHVRRNADYSRYQLSRQKTSKENAICVVKRFA